MLLIQVDSVSSNSTFFVDYAEYIVGIPVFILSTWIAIWIYKRQSNKKELTYSCRSAIKVIDIKSNFKSRLEIHFDKKKVDELYLFIIDFVNSGNQPINTADFESPIIIELGNRINKNVVVLSSGITQKDPPNIAAELNGEGTSFQISPCLLNSGDSFKIQFLIDFEDADEVTFNVKARIAGIKKLKESKERQTTNSKTLFLELMSKIPGGFFAAVIISLLTGLKVVPELFRLVAGLFR